MENVIMFEDELHPDNIINTPSQLVKCMNNMYNEFEAINYGSYIRFTISDETYFCKLNSDRTVKWKQTGFRENTAINPTSFIYSIRKIKFGDQYMDWFAIFDLRLSMVNRLIEID